MRVALAGAGCDEELRDRVFLILHASFSFFLVEARRFAPFPAPATRSNVT